MRDREVKNEREGYVCGFMLWVGRLIDVDWRGESDSKRWFSKNKWGLGFGKGKLALGRWWTRILGVIALIGREEMEFWEDKHR